MTWLPYVGWAVLIILWIVGTVLLFAWPKSKQTRETIGN